MRDLPLLRLLQLFDSQFPIGAFAHSTVIRSLPPDWPWWNSP